MNKRVTRTLIILIALIAAAVYIRRSTNVPEKKETPVAVVQNSQTQTDVQYVLPDDEVPLKINGVNGDPVQDQESEKVIEVGVQPVRYTRDLGV